MFNYTEFKVLNSHVIEFYNCQMIIDIEPLEIYENEEYISIRISNKFKKIGFFGYIDDNLEEIQTGEFEKDIFDYYFKSLFYSPNLTSITLPWYHPFWEEPMDFSQIPEFIKEYNSS